MINPDKYTSFRRTYFSRLIHEVNLPASNNFIRNVYDILKGTFTRLNVVEAIAPEEISLIKEKKERFMSEETELTLLRKLEEFETDLGFINPHLSLASLSGDLKTNTKYLSYVINTHKKKDFNNYINDLRVFYFIEIIQETPVYLNYKISYLSKECGFSSHSRFATVFKNTTGVTPSAFLNQIKQESIQEKFCS